MARIELVQRKDYTAVQQPMYIGGNGDEKESVKKSTSWIALACICCCVLVVVVIGTTFAILNYIDNHPTAAADIQAKIKNLTTPQTPTRRMRVSSKTVTNTTGQFLLCSVPTVRSNKAIIDYVVAPQTTGLVTFQFVKSQRIDVTFILPMVNCYAINQPLNSVVAYLEKRISYSHGPYPGDSIGTFGISYSVLAKSGNDSQSGSIVKILSNPILNANISCQCLVSQQVQLTIQMNVSHLAFTLPLQDRNALPLYRFTLAFTTLSKRLEIFSFSYVPPQTLVTSNFPNVTLLSCLDYQGKNQCGSNLSMGYDNLFLPDCPCANALDECKNGICESVPSPSQPEIIPVDNQQENNTTSPSTTESPSPASAESLNVWVNSTLDFEVCLNHTCLELQQVIALSAQNITCYLLKCNLSDNVLYVGGPLVATVQNLATVQPLNIIQNSNVLAIDGSSNKELAVEAIHSLLQILQQSDQRVPLQNPTSPVTPPHIVTIFSSALLPTLFSDEDAVFVPTFLGFQTLMAKLNYYLNKSPLLFSTLSEDLVLFNNTRAQSLTLLADCVLGSTLAFPFQDADVIQAIICENCYAIYESRLEYGIPCSQIAQGQPVQFVNLLAQALVDYNQLIV